MAPSRPHEPRDVQSAGDLEFFADFPNASVDFEVTFRDGVYNVAPYSWMHFGVRGVRGRRPVFRTDRPDHLDERRRLVWSADGRTWSYFDIASPEGDHYEFANEEPFDVDRVYVAGLFPYRGSDLADLLAQLRDEPTVSDLGPRGFSVQRRPIHGLRITDQSIPDERKLDIVAIAGQHAWEAWGRHVCHGFLEAAVSDATEARSLRRKAIIHGYPMANPDGIALGKARDGTVDHNPNRAWESGSLPTGSRSPVPEVDVLRRAILDDVGGGADYLLDFHSHAGWYDRFMWYADGDDPAVVELVEAIHRADAKRHEAVLVGTEIVGGAPDPERKTSKLWGTETLGATSLTFEATPHGCPSLERYQRAGDAFVAGLDEVLPDGP